MCLHSFVLGVSLFLPTRGYFLLMGLKGCNCPFDSFVYKQDAIFMHVRRGAGRKTLKTD